MGHKQVCRARVAKNLETLEVDLLVPSTFHPGEGIPRDDIGGCRL